MPDLSSIYILDKNFQEFFKKPVYWRLSGRAFNEINWDIYGKIFPYNYYLCGLYQKKYIISYPRGHIFSIFSPQLYIYMMDWSLQGQQSALVSKIWPYNSLIQRVFVENYGQPRFFIKKSGIG